MGMILDITLAGGTNTKHPALIALNAVSEALGPGRLFKPLEHEWEIEWPTGVTQGTIVIERIPYAGYAGTGSAIGSVSHNTTTTPPKVDRIAYSGVIGGWVRARVSSALNGSDGVTVRYRGSRHTK